MKGDVQLLQLLEDYLSQGEAIIDTVESRNIEYAETNLPALYGVRDSGIKFDLLSHLIDAVGDRDGGVASEKLGRGGLARARASDN